jgi:hypothetical protein
LTEILQGLGYVVDRIFSHTAMLGSVRTAQRLSGRQRARGMGDGSSGLSPLNMDGGEKVKNVFSENVIFYVGI